MINLNPLVFSIHGCIDGYSRKLIWLEVGPTNKLPEVIAKVYLDSVKKLEGVPQQLKADDGTEHSLIEPIHVYLRSLGNIDDGLQSFSIISSLENQRIESYWSTLQRDRIGWWKRFFQDLVDLNLFTNTDSVLVDCIRFCFMKLIRQEVESIRDEWGAHIISRSRNNGPRGRPDTMFYLPHLYNANECIVPVNLDEVDQFYACVNNSTVDDVSPEFKEFAETLILQEWLTPPNNATEALNLYVDLLSKVEQYS